MGFGFAALALICAVALLGPLLSVPKLVRLPVVVGELLVGIVVGQTGFGWLDSTDPTFAFLASMGFLMVMLVAGTHVPIRDPAIRAGLRTGLVRALLIGAVAAPVGIALASLFNTGHGTLYAVLIASSSASIAMPVLDGYTGDRDQLVALLPQLAVADAACIVLVPLVVDPPHAGRAALGAVAVIAAGAVLALVLRQLTRSGLERRLHEFSEEHTLALELRLCLVAAFSVAAVAIRSHVSVMLAGFVVGLALSWAGETKRLSHQLFAMTEGLFAPIFFVWLGTSLNLRDLASHPSAIALGLSLGVVSVLVHCLPRLLPGRFRQPLGFGVLSAAQMGVPVAAATLGSELGVLHPGEGTALLLSAIVTIVAVSVAGRGLTGPSVPAAAVPPGSAPHPGQGQG